MNSGAIENNVRKILETLPESVTLVAAAKTRSADEVRAAILGGIKILGYNYVQEAATIKQELEENFAVSPGMSLRSISTAVTCPARARSSPVRMPMPGPISSTLSAGVRAAVSAIFRAIAGFTRKC